mmetsp:Transcript_7076/g.22985  ORF Transcript_7076/g.22985 Transcript_7076/m.22985 type:complete len:280 (-) Transcript_7076:1154-1993(-)
MSFGVKMPFKAPPASITKQADLVSAIIFEASATEQSSSTTMPRLPWGPSRAPRVFAEGPANASKRGLSASTNRALAAACADWFGPFKASSRTCLEAWAPWSTSFSIFEMASYRHLWIDSTPQTPPMTLSTGKCRNRFCTINFKASRAASVAWTHLGDGVMMVDTANSTGTSLATPRKATSLSVKIPTKTPSSTSRAQSHLFADISIETVAMLSVDFATKGWSGRMFVTVFSLCKEPQLRCVSEQELRAVLCSEPELRCTEGLALSLEATSDCRSDAVSL